MSGTTTTRRNGLAAVEARARPVYQTSITRNRGTTWAYPGFGRDPELGQVPLPAAPAPVPAAAPTSETEDRRNPVSAPAAMSGGGGGGDNFGNDGGTSAGDGGFNLAADMAANPGLYADPALANYVVRGLAALGIGVGSATQFAAARTDPNVLQQVPVSISDRLMDPAQDLVAEGSLAGGQDGGTKDAPAQGDPMAGKDGSLAGAVEPAPEPAPEPIPEPPPPPPPAPEPAPAPAPAPEFSDVNWGSSDAGHSDYGGSFSDAPEGVSDVGDFGGSYGGFGDFGGDFGGGFGGDFGGDFGGWQRGGYTGAGSDGVVQPGQPAGTVHEGEVVIPAHQVQQHGLGPLMALAGPGAKMGPGGGGLGAVQAAGGGGGAGGAIQPFQSPTAGPPSPPAIPGAPQPQDAARSVPSFQTPTSGPPTPPGAGMGPDNGSGPMMPLTGGAPAPAASMLAGMPMGDAGASAMMGGGTMGEVPIEDDVAATASDAEVSSFQSTTEQALAGFGGESEGGEEDDGYEMVDVEDDGDDPTTLGPYRDLARTNDPFKAPDPSRGVTGSMAMQNLAALPPDAQQAVMMVLGGNPMLSSALLQVLGPSFQGFITTALKAGAPPMAQPGMAPPPGGGGLGMIG